MRWATRLIGGFLLVITVITGGTAWRVWQVAQIDERRPVAAIVVLGAAQYNGEPSEVLAARLRQAHALFDSGIAPRIVTTGGARPGDAYTEAEAGRRYLIDQGVPAGAVVALGQGADTLASVRATAARAARDGWNTALIVSDPWHSLRARRMARDSGMQAWTSPTRTGPGLGSRDSELRYILRETAALLYYELTHASVAQHR